MRAPTAANQPPGLVCVGVPVCPLAAARLIPLRQTASPPLDLHRSGAWVLLYAVEAIAILAVLNQYPNDSQKAVSGTGPWPPGMGQRRAQAALQPRSFGALPFVCCAVIAPSSKTRQPFQPSEQDRTIRRMTTPTKRMLPLKLSTAKRALYALAGLASRRPATAAAAALVAPAPPAPPAPSAPAAFRDGSATLERVIEEIEQDAATPPRLPRGPQLPEVPKAVEGPSLADRRRAGGLRPGQLDPASLPSSLGRRERELLDRKVGRVAHSTRCATGRARRRSDLTPATASLTPKPEAASQPPPHACASGRPPPPPQSYLRNFWYAAALSSSLTDDTPLGVDILGGRVVLFRDQDGKVCGWVWGQ